MLDARGKIVLERTQEVARGHLEVEFTQEERERMAALGAGAIEILALSDDGEFLGRSPPARFALLPQAPDGW